MKKLCFFFTIAISLAACKKDPYVGPDKFVKGEIIVGITSDADLKTVFSTFNDLDFKIKQMSGFTYAVPIGADSLTAFLKYLNTKPYFVNSGFKAYAYYVAANNYVKNASLCFNMTPSNQGDLLDLIKNGNWRDLHEDYRDIYMNIPPGSEQYWLNELKKYPFVKWTELNAYLEMHVD